MSLQPQLIAPFETGLQTDLEPWLAPIDSFTEFDNLHIHHGRIEKRQGYTFFGALQPDAATVNINAITQANPGAITTAAAHGLTTGDKVFITGVTGMTTLNGKIFDVTVTGATTFTINLDTTNLTAYAGGGTIAVIDDSVDRCMGVYRYIEDDNTKATLAFNTKRAYVYDEGSNLFDQLDAADIMSGADTDYIWAENWQSTNLQNRLYFTNGKAYDGASLDGIRYYAGGGLVTVSFVPELTPSGTAVGSRRFLYGSKLIFTLKQRLLVLNTYEHDESTATTTNFPQRARWCQAQGPSNWDDITPGGGGYVDAPTGGHIISARAIQGGIIVFFTDSVWTIRPVSDPALPFKWEKINDFRACDGKMASVGYDRYATALGVRGITATDGVETRRIDGRISDFVIDNINVDEFSKVNCLRSYSNLRWWTIYAGGSNTENNRALIYDDDSSAFSTYTISLNCLGYGNAGYDFGLDDFIAANGKDWSLVDGPGDSTLQDYFYQQNQEILLGGDIYGSIFQLETGGTDDGGSIDTELFTAAWNPYKEQGVECQLSHVDLLVDTDKKTLATFEFYKNDEISSYKSEDFDFLPNLDYVVSVINVTQANPANVNAADHGLTTGDVIYIYGVQGMTELPEGPHTITVVDVNNFTLDGVNSSAFSAYTTGGQVMLRRFYKTKTWKRVYAGAYGYQHRMKMLATGGNEPYNIYAFKLYTRPRGKRTVT